VTLNGQELSIKGGKNGSLVRSIHAGVEVTKEDNVLKFAPRDGIAGADAQAGTARALANNMVIGVTEGFERKLQLVGVGYKASIKGNAVALALGFSHPVEHALPAGVTAECPTATEIVLRGAGQAAGWPSRRRYPCLPRPEPYKGKGVRYANERAY
jgi:large subunit ribosomal protein L6